MPFTTREQVAVALFNLISVAVGSVVGLKTSARRIVMPADVAPGSTPALYQFQTKEHYEREPGGLIGIPPKRTMLFEHIVYVTDDAATVGGVRNVPSTQLNTIMQAVEAAFPPDPNTGECTSTLGGLVLSARIEGDIDVQETRKIGGLSMLVIPVHVLIP